MKNKEFFKLPLPKWPALLVVGKNITPEQAKEIIIRTDSLYLSSNDGEFDKQLQEYLYDITTDQPGWGEKDKSIRKKLGLSGDSWEEVWEYEAERRKEIGHIDINYLNNSRVVSSWIGGPHGWCHWNGNIESDNYNIGKYPSVEEVYKEWVLIAKAFPFLDLTSQLLDKECGEEGSQPVIEFKVKSGKVKMSLPKLKITNDEFGEEDISRRFSPFGERGCTFDQFKDAVDFCRNKFK